MNVDTSAKDTKWSWKDLKNTVKSGINAAKTAYNTYKTVKNTVETTVEQAKKIGTAIKNSGGGLDGVLDTLGQVATASDTIFNTVKTGANAVVANTASIANDIQTAGKSSAELKFDEENQNRIAELEKKLAAGNLTEEQQEWAKAELEQRKAAVDSNKVTDWANTKGKEITDSINKVASTASTASKITRTASSAADQGSNIGGDAVGAIFGLATAAGFEVVAFKFGYQGLIDNSTKPLTREDVSNIAHLGGSNIKSTRSSEFLTKQGFKRAIQNIKLNEIDCLVVLGGDGTLRGAKELSAAGIKVVYIPATIDNDLSYTDQTLGFDSAVNAAVDAIDKIKQTMLSTADSVDKLAQNLNKVMDAADAEQTGKNLKIIAENLSEISVSVNEITKDEKLKKQITDAIDNANCAMSQVATTLETVNRVNPANANQASDLEKIVSDTVVTTSNLRKFSEKLNKRFLLFRLLF